MAETPVLKTAVHYTRESEEAAAFGGFGLDTHRRQGEAYAAQHGLVITETLVDVVTGTLPIRQREAGKRLYEYIDGVRRVDAVIFPRLDRATRDEEAIEILQIRSDIRRAGMELHYVDRGKADLSRWGGIADFVIGIKAAEEREEIVRKTTEAKVDRALAGNTLVGARPPYGYQRISKARTATQKGSQRLEIDPTEAQVVRDIFEWYTDGLLVWDADLNQMVRRRLSQMGIARRLTELGIPTRAETHPGYPVKRRRGWDVSVVGAILRNTVYATGVWTYRKRKTTSPKWIDRSIPAKLRPPEQRYHFADTPESQHIRVSVPALLDENGRRQFELAQVRLAEPKDTHPSAFYLLKGLAECALCGRNLVGHMDGGSAVYKCSANREARHIRTACRAPQFTGRVIEAAMWEVTRRMLLDPDDIVRSMNRPAGDAQPDARLQAERELTALDRQGTDAEQERRNYQRMLAQNRMTEAAFDEEAARLDREARQRLLRRTEIEGRLKALGQARQRVQDVRALAARAGHNIETATPQMQRYYMQQMQLRARVAREGEEYVVWVTAPYLKYPVEARVARPTPEDRTRERAQARARVVLTEAAALMAQGWSKTRIVAHLGTSLHTLRQYLTRAQYSAIRKELGID